MPRNVRPGRGQPEVRQERQEIREYLDKLRQLVPGCPKAGKLSRLAVIQHVIDYIVELQDTLVHHPVNSILANPDLQDLATSIPTHPDHHSDHYYPHNPDYSPPSSLNPGEEDLSLTSLTTTTPTTTPPLHQDQEYSNSLHPNYPTPPHQSYDDDYPPHHHQQDSTNTPLHHENHDYSSPPPHHQQHNREVYRRAPHHNNEEVYSSASHPHNRHYSAPHHPNRNNEEVYSSASHSRNRHYSAPHHLHNQEVYNAPHHSIEKDSVQPTTTTITTTPPDVTKTNRKHTNTSTGSCRRPLGVLSSLKTHRNQ
ncbi:hypothetical protein Pcinc_011405 [Petrolisthes cinctipes]|uniref:BHLH domain-containing protein n=1 Tax=Petrolisthes cinctipes TaxID=88211 RepID=A0AAE1KUG0_PETCI|nr:hypothetical protein Pcinc_011405 [Petrolisthes cinctipes]